jgi:hypothetical protein
MGRFPVVARGKRCYIYTFAAEPKHTTPNWNGGNSEYEERSGVILENICSVFNLARAAGPARSDTPSK